MGAVVASLAFPCPPKTLSRDALMSRPDLVWIKTSKEGEEVPAVHLRRADAHFTILYAHGNAEDVGLSLPYLESLAASTNSSVLAFEYPGYSISRPLDVQPSEAGCFRAINAAWQRLASDPECGPQRVVLFGRSLGSGPVVDLASRLGGTPDDCAGVLLQSPLESGARAVFGRTVAFFGRRWDVFKNYEKIGSVTAPVAIIHGTDDDVVPCSNGRALAAAAQNVYPSRWLQGYGHNNMHLRTCHRYAREFLQHCADLMRAQPFPAAGLGGVKGPESEGTVQTRAASAT
jgi:pimeloyl-ACP methyl ester carboxylesterase